MPTRHIIIFMTCPSRKTASRIARVLLKKRMIACANIAPGIESLFRWKGKIEKANEALVIMKSRSSRFSAIEREIRKLHPYEVPEIIALPIIAGYKPYLEWIEEECSD